MKIASLYRRAFQNSRRERLFWASLTFFVSFAVVRGIALCIRMGIGPFRNLVIREVHIHHLVWGIFLLLLVGYLWLVQFGTDSSNCSSRGKSRATAMLYGLGAGLTLDEFALWLHLEDVYWSPEGRASIDAVILFGALLSAGLWGRPFFRAVIRETARSLRQIVLTLRR